MLYIDLVAESVHARGGPFFKQKIKSADPNMGVNRMSEIGCFFQIHEIQHLCCFITQLVEKLQGIENILPFVLNTKWPLSDIWLLCYKQNSFGCF